MASFYFAVDNFTIQNTRSKHKDTDYFVCTCKAPAEGMVTLPPISLGDRNSGTFPIEQQLPGVDLGPGEQLVFNYMIVNAGSAKAADIEAALKQTSQAWASGQGPASTNFIGALEDGQTWFNDELKSILNPNSCDGMVAAEQDHLSYEDLIAVLVPGQTLIHEVHHPGVRSPSGCGPNSSYTVKWGMFLSGDGD